MKDPDIVWVGGKKKQNLMKANKRIDISKSPSADRLEELLDMSGITRAEEALSLVEPGQQSIE